MTKIVRTDLAIEENENIGNKDSGVSETEETVFGIKINRINIDETASKKLKKHSGEYITIICDEIDKNIPCGENLIRVLKTEIKKLLPKKEGTVLVCGFGNSDITPDAVGPFTANKILATRHIDKNTAMELGLEGLKSVAVCFPSVLGKTGIETQETVKCLTDMIHPKAVIVVDALAASDIEKIGKVIQITDTGINPGSGVGNCRKEISKQTLNTEVIAIGVPTVADAQAFFIFNGDNKTNIPQDFMVTPKNIDSIVLKAADVISSAINSALQENFDTELINQIV